MKDLKLIYRLLTFLVISIIPFFPKQQDVLINYIIYAFSLVLIPIFIANLIQKLKQKDLITIFFLLFLLSATISTIFSIDLPLSLLSLLLYFSYFIIFISIPSIFETTNQKLQFLAIIVIISVILSVISLYNTLILHLVNREVDGVSFMWIYFGHNHLTSILIVSIPIVFYLIINYCQNLLKRFFLFIILIILLISFYLSFARGAYIAVLASIITTLLILRMLSFKKTILLSIFTIFLISVYFFILQNLVNYYGIYQKKINLSLRDIYWQRSINNWINNPLIGSGPNTVRYANYPKTNQNVLTSEYSHNAFLEVLSDTGILGSIPYVLTITIPFLTFITKKNKNSFQAVIFCVTLASLVNGLMDYDLQIPSIQLIFWVLISFLNDPQNSSS